MEISIDRLLLAYRKTKFEAFRDTADVHGAKFLKFESNFKQNLEKLQETLRSDAWAQSMDMLGEVTFIPKSIEPPNPPEDAAHYEDSDPFEQWRRRCAHKKATAAFRPVISATVEYMLISTLWILEVGHLFDKKLSERAMGNRLKRESSTEKDINEHAFELFKPYSSAYGKWQEDGLKAIRTELEAGGSVLVLTMDLKRFYHNVDASFLLNESFLSKIDDFERRSETNRPVYHKTGILRSEIQVDFTKTLLTSFQTYNREVKKLTGWSSVRGLPVGLSAAAVVANILLKKLDDRIEKLRPVYYGRYVDDVFLVLHSSPEIKKFASAKEIMHWLVKKFPCLSVSDSQDETGLRIKLPYAGKSNLLFSDKKQRIFQLDGKSGLDLIAPIDEQLRKQSSEHRDMPDLPETEKQMAHRALFVSSNPSELPTALRKADAVTLRRSEFAMLLGDAEAYSRDLPPDEWKKIRHLFLGFAIRHLPTPLGFFEFSRYYPRVLALMVQNNDLEQANEFLNKLKETFDVIQATCEFDNDELFRDELFRLLKRRQGNALLEAVLKVPSHDAPMREELLKRIDTVCGTRKGRYAARCVSAIHKRLLRLDWAQEPYWQHWLDKGTTKPSLSPSFLGNVFKTTFNAISIFGKMSERFPSDELPVVFPTRKFPMYELIRNAQDLLKCQDELALVLKGLLEQDIAIDKIKIKYDKDEETFLILNSLFESAPETVKIAISNIEVSKEEWECAAKGNPLLTLERYKRLNGLIDSAVECLDDSAEECLKKPKKPKYLVLPECCLPRRWERNTVMRTLGRGVFLIAGLEYKVNGSKVHNEALIALATDFLEFQTCFPLIQTKTLPAPREENKLGKLQKKFVKGKLPHPIYSHNGFCFGVLICSELTDIRNRLRFQGEVDALFVPAWNKDIDTFSSLIESSALDIHAYIIQANNSRYGDSRIRAPMKTKYKKDILQTKGGVNDFFVVGIINIEKLRDFQIKTPHGEEDKPDEEEAAVKFKPVPGGFKISELRKQRALEVIRKQDTFRT